MNKYPMQARIFMLVWLFLLSTNAFSQDPNFHIYICFGQSNMEGQGAIEAQDKTVDSRFKVLQSLDCSNLSRNKAAWYTAVPPLCQCNSGLSPADYFGRTMVANLPDSITVGVINVAIGGCDIRLFDKDLYQDHLTTQNNEEFFAKIESYGGNPLEHLMNLAKLAQQDGVIKGILMHQGEQNNGDSNWPKYVEKVYNDMLNELSLKADSVPLLAGEVLYTGIFSAMNPIIRLLPNTVPTAHIISAEGLTGDWGHFTSQGYRLLGMRYAVEMLSLLGVDADILEPEATSFEAECSEFGDNWNETTDVNASNKSYVTIKPGINNINEASTDSANAIYFDFTAKSDTTFFVYARLNCPNTNNDSYWVKMDNEPFEYIDNLGTSGWNWLKLKSYNLNVGNHTFVVANGEEGAKLDKIFISNYDSVPTGMGDAAIRICNNIVHQVSGKIEAELFADQYGTQTEYTGDIGGGLNVGWIDDNDWLEYNIDVDSDTIYLATFRCASPGSGGSISILLDDEEVGDVSFSGTGNWQVYESFTTDITLKAGKHTLKIVVTKGGFNFNWFMFEKDNVTGIKDANGRSFNVFPNPTDGLLNIESNAFLFHNIEIIDYAGKIIYSRNFVPSKLISFNPHLQKGIYCLKLSNNIEKQNIKIIID